MLLIVPKSRNQSFEIFIKTWPQIYILQQHVHVRLTPNQQSGYSKKKLSFSICKKFPTLIMVSYFLAIIVRPFFKIVMNWLVVLLMGLIPLVERIVDESKGTCK